MLEVLFGLVLFAKGLSKVLLEKLQLLLLVEMIGEPYPLSYPNVH